MDASRPSSPQQTLGVDRPRRGPRRRLRAPAALALLHGRIVGRDGPDFSLARRGQRRALPGTQTKVTLSDLRGNAVLLDFWATWCEPCRIEAPIVDRVARRWRDKGVVVVGVNEDTPDQGDPRAFALAEGLSYPIAADPAARPAQLYDVDSLPTLVVVSRTGKVTAVRTGITEDAELERLIRQALDNGCHARAAQREDARRRSARSNAGRSRVHGRRRCRRRTSRAAAPAS